MEEEKPDYEFRARMVVYEIGWAVIAIGRRITSFAGWLGRRAYERRSR